MVQVEYNPFYTELQYVLVEKGELIPKKRLISIGPLL